MYIGPQSWGFAWVHGVNLQVWDFLSTSLVFNEPYSEQLPVFIPDRTKWPSNDPDDTRSNGCIVMQSMALGARCLTNRKWQQVKGQVTEDDFLKCRLLDDEKI